MTKKVAVFLTGCGHLDGSEIHESVFTLLSLEKHGFEWECIAIDEKQHHVINHTSQSEQTLDRNMLEEGARIARGKIKALKDVDVDDYDSLIFPGGFGAAKNIFDFAFKGEEYEMRKEVLDLARAFYVADKPVGFICIAPMMIPLIYPVGVKATIRTDRDTGYILQEKGAEFISTPATDICIDEEFKVISTPAYMNAHNMLEVAEGIDKLVMAIKEFT